MLRLTFVVWLSCVVWLQSFNHLDSLYPSAGHPADPASVIVWKRPLRSPMPGNARKSKFASGQNYWECNSRCSKASQRYSNTVILHIPKLSTTLLISFSTQKNKTGLLFRSSTLRIGIGTHFLPENHPTIHTYNPSSEWKETSQYHVPTYF